MSPSRRSGLIFFLCTLLINSLAHPLEEEHNHQHSARRSLPGNSWHHDDDSPLHALFRREGATSFPQVGSPTWLAAYPTTTPDVTKTPAAWTNSLSAAVAAGKIPNIPPTQLVNGYPTYPNNLNQLDPSICSATGKCKAPGDVWDAPPGSIGIGFDDGPVAFNDSSHNLYAFLKSQKQIATHFMIGIAIYQAPSTFLEAFNQGDDIAVHTYTHPYMTTLSNEDVLAQFGWSMQIIYDSTGGRIPKFWRPPMGNMDNRIRAIANEVFGLTPILWNQDSEDWTMTQPGGQTPAGLAANLTAWINGPQSPGLIILEHELTNDTVTGFINAYPQMLQKKWKTISVARLVPSNVDNQVGQVYWNAQPGNAGSPDLSKNIVSGGKFANATSSFVAPTSSTSSSSLSYPSLPYSSGSSTPTGSTTPTPSGGSQAKTGGATSTQSMTTVSLCICIAVSLWTLIS